MLLGYKAIMNKIATGSRNEKGNIHTAIKLEVMTYSKEVEFGL